MLNSCRLGLVVWIIVLPGCSVPFLGGYGENGKSKEEFAVYVEKVFQFQNRLTSEVMMLMESGEGLNQFDDLLVAEQNMHKICAPLNEYAARENDGLSIGLLLRRRVEKSAVACEKAAKQVDIEIKKLGAVS